MSEEEIQEAVEYNLKRLEGYYSIEEVLEETMECLKKANKQLDQYKSIIKEVREYIDKDKASLPMGRDEFTCEMRYSDPVVLAQELLEILDKVGD